MLIASLIPAFEQPREVSGSFANYAALRIATLMSTDDQGWMQYIHQDYGDPYLLSNRTIAALSSAFTLTTVDVTPYQLVKIVRDECFTINQDGQDVTIDLDWNVFSRNASNQVRGLATEVDIDLCRALYNHVLVDISVALGEGQNAKILSFLPRLGYPIKPHFYYLRVFEGHEGAPLANTVEVEAGIVPISKITNGGALRVLSAAPDLNVASVANQIDLKGLVLACTTTSSDTLLGLFKFDQIPTFDFQADSGLYYNALIDAGLLTKTDLPSQSNRSHYSTICNFVSPTGLFQELKQDLALLQQLWDAYQVGLRAQAGEMILLGSYDEYDANAVHSKLGLMAQCGGLPLMSLFTALLSDPLASDSGNRTRELWLSRWECEDVIDHLPNMVVEANFFYLNCGPSQLCRIDMVENLQKVLAGHNFDAAITDGRWVFYDPAGNLVNRQDYFMTANSLRQNADGTWTAVQTYLVVKPSNLRGALLKSNKKALPLDEAARGRHLSRWNLLRDAHGYRVFPLGRAPALYTPADRALYQNFRLVASSQSSISPDSQDVDAEHNPPDVTPPMPPDAPAPVAAEGAIAE
nr:hypothetical protein [Molussus totiviridae 1]